MRQLGRGFGRGAAFDCKQHQRRPGLRRHQRCDLQALCRHQAPAAFQIGEGETALRQRGQHAQAPDKGHRHAGRRESAADEAADRTRTHHQHLAGGQFNHGARSARNRRAPFGEHRGTGFAGPPVLPP